VEALFHDLLIGVTNYFRDPEAFKVLEDQVIPRIFAGKPANAVIRVWSAGCSTGEEAYSLAILIAERQEAMKQSFKVQVFATDIDKAAIAVARNGVYPASIASDISAQRLTRFFTTDPNGNSYRIHKNIRDMVIFSEHNVIKDPPFSRMELISCRNLIIYFGAELQKKLFPLFHAALNPGSILFLGTSETTGEFDDLFSVLDRSSKLYQRRESFHSKQNADFTNFVPAMSAIDVSLPRAAASPLFPQKFPLRELTEQALLNQITHVSLLVNGQGKILFTHGRSGRFLELPPGEIGVSIVLTMAREGLRYELTLALQRVARTKETVRSKDLQIKTDNSLIRFNLAVSPVGTESTAPMDEFLYLVILEELPLLEITDLPANESGSTSSGTGAHITALEQELHTKEKYIQAVNEELESTNEDLKSANEEMLSVNEELQSTNEELETSKEELQSVNEELSTVNTELQNKVGDLLRVNNDMTNLLAGTGIGTIFVDHHLRIMRFTPTATHIINLISSDIGRPISHISSNLVGYDHLLTDIHSVLDTLVPVEADVQTAAGIWYAMRIHPYRTLENVIEGAVLTFVDITEMIQVRAALRESESLSRLAVVVRDAHDAITVQDLQGQILAWNPGAERIYGWSESEALKMTIHDMTPENLRAEAFGVMKRLVRAAVLEPYRMQRITKNGRIVEVWLTATALLNEAGVVYAIATTERERGLEKEV